MIIISNYTTSSNKFNSIYPSRVHIGGIKLAQASFFIYFNI